MYKDRSVILGPVLLIAFILILDTVSKFFTQYYLPHMNMHYWYPYGGIAVFKDFFGIEFSISHATNKGAAWGVFSQYQFVLLLLRICLIAGLAGYFFLGKRSVWQQFCLALILGGAIGNVIDYFIYGHVIDMLHFIFFGYDFPVFNLADTAIFLGVSGYLLNSCREKQIA